LVVSKTFYTFVLQTKQKHQVRVLENKVQNFNIKYLVKQKTFCNFALQYQMKSDCKKS